MSTLKEDLEFLLQIQSLDLKIQKHLMAIDEEQSRYTRVENFRETRLKRKEILEKQTVALKQELTDLEKALHDLESKLTSSESHLSQVKSEAELKALESEMATLSPAVDEQQNLILSMMEEQEEIDAELEEIETYLQGSKVALQEIQNEIDEVSKKENHEIKKLTDQIDLINSNVSDESLSIFNKTNEKYRFNRPISFIVGNSCRECRFQIDNATIQEIDRYQTLGICSGCGRILTINR